LESITIDGLRGLENQTVNFRFPVSVIVGENGTRKSTFLKSAVCAYVGATKNFLSNFFVSTHWDKISGVSISYTLRQGDQIISFKMGKGNKKWSYSSKRPIRDVFFFDISRTLPLDAAAGYAKIARLATGELSEKELRPEIKDRLSHIMGRDYTNARFIVPDIDKRKEIGLLRRQDCGEISSFHQGAGEDATFDLMKILQDISNTSLVIIDEVEASLHPKAQRRLIRFLLWLSCQKRIQIILSTHSPYILEELPPEARIMLLPTADGMDVIYGASPEFSLSNLDENVHPDVYIYVEDRESETLLREIIVSDDCGKDLIHRIRIMPVGDADVVHIMNKLGRQRRLPHKSIAVSDGDRQVDGCLSLPGTKAPERVVFEGLRGLGWPELPNRFDIGAGSLLTYLEDAMLEPKHHKWTEIVGNQIVKSKTGVWEILSKQWCKSCLDHEYRNALTAKIDDVIASS